MIDVVTKHNAFLYRDALEQMYRLRHRIFVERMGWEDIRRPDGMERDGFDRQEAVYLILFDDDGAVIGSHRLLPTVRPHLFSELFSKWCDVRGVLVGPHIYELNRTCVDEDRLTPAKANHARKTIMVGLMEFCLKAEIEELTVLTTLRHLFRYLTIGWEIRPLGLPKFIDGTDQAAVAVKVNDAALKAAREAFDVREPLIQYLGPHPQGAAFIEHLPPIEIPVSSLN